MERAEETSAFVEDIFVTGGKTVRTRRTRRSSRRSFVKETPPKEEDEKSKTKISAVTIEGVNINGDEQVADDIDEETLALNLRDLEGIEDHSPLAAEDGNSSSVFDYGREASKSRVSTGSLGVNGAWSRRAAVPEFVPQGREFDPSPIMPGQSLDSVRKAVHRSKSVPASAFASHVANGFAGPPDIRTAFPGEDTHGTEGSDWLKSAAELALAASTAEQVSRRSLDGSVHYGTDGTNFEHGESPFARPHSFGNGGTAGDISGASFAGLAQRNYGIDQDSTVALSPYNWQSMSGSTSPLRGLSNPADESLRQAAAMHPDIAPYSLSSNHYGGSGAGQQPVRSIPHSPNLLSGGLQKMVVNNIPLDADVTVLRNVLMSYGAHDDLVVYRSPFYIGLAVVATFSDQRNATLALNHLNGYMFFGRFLGVALEPVESATGQEGGHLQRFGPTSPDAGNKTSSTSGALVMMNFESSQVASKMRRALGGQGHGKTVEFTNPGDAEKALRMLNMRKGGTDGVRLHYNGAGGVKHTQFAVPPGCNQTMYSGQPVPDSAGGNADLANGGRVSKTHLQPMTSSAQQQASSSPSNQPRFHLDIARVLSGEETRTALMIRNIPNKYNQKMMLQTLENNHKGVFDFFYLPIDFKNKCNVGYAFINFRSPVHIVPFFEEFHRRKWMKFNSEKVCEITFARIQGKANLIAHFQNSSLMNEDPKCRPIIFGGHGEQEEFPIGPHVRTKRGPSARETKVETVATAVASPSCSGASTTKGNDSAGGQSREQGISGAEKEVDEGSFTISNSSTES
uniref:Mei2-like C-terminal RNA recognition motif domain-containing protein n=1 Tax=Rhodosorus marinus TaxID=101924 RepID=A0A7S2ZXD3_9RHOD|mmetsp:Transcript_35127/g.139414  ORF Transcript_35127/g.139414 Transcript_35127/m.139414 type:complete len:795 (+) Transcript_35127:407-2791(+)